MEGLQGMAALRNPEAFVNLAHLQIVFSSPFADSLLLKFLEELSIYFLIEV